MTGLHSGARMEAMGEASASRRQEGRPPRVALTGGIATGKSTVAALLAERGAVVIDYDDLARRVVEPGSAGLAAVADEFGPGVLRADGTLDRAELGRLVFADPAGRRRLEGLLHPLIRAWAAALEAEAHRERGAGAVVVHDVPLLVETGMADDFDVIVVTDVDPAEQVSRVMARDGLSQQEARARVAAQVGRRERLARATHVVDTSGPVEALPDQVDRLWEGLAARRLETR